MLIVAISLVYLAFFWLLFSKQLFESKVTSVQGEDGFMAKIFAKKDDRLDQLLAEAFSIAEKKGFPRFECSVWGISSWILPQMFNDFSGTAIHSIYGHRIFIYWSSVRGYSDDDLRILIAHEVGHCIDFKTRRTGHPIFNRIKKFTEEEFANFISAYFYSKEMLFESARRHSFGGISLERLKNIEISDTYSVR